MENAIRTIKMNTIATVMDYSDMLATVKDELRMVTDSETTLDILEYIVSKLAPRKLKGIALRGFSFFSITLIH